MRPRQGAGAQITWRFIPAGAPGVNGANGGVGAKHLLVEHEDACHQAKRLLTVRFQAERRVRVTAQCAAKCVRHELGARTGER